MFSYPFWFSTMLSALILNAAPQQPQRIHLEPAEYTFMDTATYIGFHVKLVNPGDTAVFIERVHPSCGCVGASVQSNRAVAGKPGDLYVSLVPKRMDTLQPVTVDVYLNRNPDAPLRLTIWKTSGGPHP